MTSTLVLGVDPGSHTAGLSVWDSSLPEPQALLACVPLTTGLRVDDPAPLRLAAVFAHWLREATAAFTDAAFTGAGPPPHVTVAIEHLVGHGVPPAPELDVFCHGVAQVCAALGWTYVEYTPRQWHEAVRLRGAPEPDKEAVRWAMEARFPNLRALRDVEAGSDAVEAAAIGLHHYARERLAAGFGRSSERFVTAKELA